MGNTSRFALRPATLAAFLLVQISSSAWADNADNVNWVKDPPPLIQFTPAGTETLVDAGLNHLATLWIPASYTGSHDALYINGKHYSAPGGFNDVPSFIKTPGGYTVAVRQDSIQINAPQVAAPAGGLRAQKTQLLQQQVQQIQQMTGLTPTQRAQMLTMLMQATLPTNQNAATAPQMSDGQFIGGVLPSPGLVFYSVSPDGQTLATIGSLPASKTARVLVHCRRHLRRAAERENGL